MLLSGCTAWHGGAVGKDDKRSVNGWWRRRSLTIGGIGGKERDQGQDKDEKAHHADEGE